MAGCQQIFFSRDNGNIGSGLIFKAPFAAHYTTNLTWGAPTAADATQKVLIDCDIRNLAVTLVAAPGLGSSRTFTLYKNGIATALTFTIADAATSGSSAAVVFATAGDLVYLECSVAGTPVNTTTYVTLELNGAVANETMYGGAGPMGALTTQFYCPLFSNGVGVAAGSVSSNTSLVSAPGTITTLDVALTVAPGGATSRTFAILKNGVLQDGSGGTQDTRVVLTGASLAGSSSFSLAIAAGDDVRLTQTATGPPAATTCQFSVKVNSTTDGHSNISGWNSNFLPATTAYSNPNVAGSWGATESAQLLRGPLSTITLKNFRVLATAAITNQTYTTRKNSGDTSIALNLTAATTGVDSVNTATLGSGDTWSLECDGTAGFNRTLAWAWTLEADSDYSNAPPTVSAGIDQTITLPPGTFTLAGSMSDADGPDPVTGLWTVTSGPPAGIITFTDDTDPVTTGSASHHGVYVLRLTADDGDATASDEMTLTVNPPSSGTTVGINEDPGRRGIRLEMSLGSLWMCDLETYDNDSTASAYRPEIRDRLTLDYEGQRLFKGNVITRRDRPRAATNKGNRMAIRAKANMLVTDRLELDGLEIAAGDTLKQALTAIHTHGTPSLSDEGIAMDPGMADGPTLEAVTFDGVTIQSAYNRLMNRTGWIIRHTPEDVLESFEPGDMVCAYALTEANKLALGEVTWEETARKFVNRVTVKFGTGRRFTPETFTGDGVTTTFALDYPMDGYLAYTADGAVGYAVVDVSWGTTEPLGGVSSGLTWTYDPATQSVTRSSAPANATTFTVRKDSDFPLTVTVEDAVSIAAVGLYKRTFELPDVYDLAEATEQAEGLLRAGTATPKVIKVRTKEYPMPLPGDVVNLHYTDRLIPDDNYLITRIDATDYIFDGATLQHKFEFVLTCVEGTENHQSWTDTLKGLIGAG
jgi:hypothetical protein